MRPLLTADEMRACETRAIQGWGIFSLLLQEHAAMGALALLPEGEPIHVLAGPGNNGGDALALARLAKLKGFEVEVYPVAQPQGAPRWKGDAAVQARLWEGLGGKYAHTDYPLREAMAWKGWVVDGIFGLGARPPLPDAVLPWIKALENIPRPFKALALDLPTGLDPSSGDIPGPAVRADVTACFGHLKRCHGLMPAKELCGDVTLVPIPLDAAPQCSMMQLSEPGLCGPAWDSHKYGQGHVTIRAGAKGMGGAAVLAAMGALRGGAGLVTVLPDADVADVVASQIPEAIVRPWEGALPDRVDVLLVGPGGVGEVPEWDGPLVLDASALKEGGGPRWAARPDTIITPHAGEFSRLFGLEAPKGTQARIEAIAKLNVSPSAAIVLKGAQTLIRGGSGPILVNPTGHPGLATGGTGDFLAGLMAARLAWHVKHPDGGAAGSQKCTSAASEAVWLHGAAADRLGKGPLLVGELGPALTQLLRKISGA